jgi:hypothetical protein
VDRMEWLLSSTMCASLLYLILSLLLLAYPPPYRSTEYSLKGSAYLTENLLDPATSHSSSVADTACVRGNNLGCSIWEHFAKPGNELLVAKFGTGMKAVKYMGGVSEDGGAFTLFLFLLSLLDLPSLFFPGFPFKDLPEGATVVDVGAGVGGASLAFAKAAPHVNFVLQDRPEVVAEAQAVRSLPSLIVHAYTDHRMSLLEQVWEKENPEAIKSGRVKLAVHDFFQPQPVKGADVYFFRVVMCVHLFFPVRLAFLTLSAHSHDWGNHFNLFSFPFHPSH